MMVTRPSMALTTDVAVDVPALSAVVVLPTYNEVANVPITLEAIMATGPLVEVLVVDDNSPDGTADVVLEVAQRHPGRIHLLRRPGKEGLGAAYRAGLAWALDRGYDAIVQMDADGSHPADRLPMLLAALALDVADLAVGSRYVSGAGTENWSLSRRALSRSANRYARTMLGIGQRDVTGGFRAWSREALLAAGPERSSTTGYGFLVEMALAAHTTGARVIEVPITFVDRVYGESKMSRSIAIEGFRMVWQLKRNRTRSAVDAPATALHA